MERKITAGQAGKIIQRKQAPAGKPSPAKQPAGAANKGLSAGKPAVTRKPAVRMKNGHEMSSILSGEEKKRLVKQKAKELKHSDIPKTAQQTITFQEMFKDGICRVTDHYYTKCIQFGDTNYQLAQNEDKTAIFEYWCDFYNYFDSSIHLQISCMSQYANVKEMEKAISIADQGDGFNDVREEYEAVLRHQLEKGNNGLIRMKYATFGIEAKDLKEAKPKLERIETDIVNNLHLMGVTAKSLTGYERLKILYTTMNEEHQEPFIFNYDLIAQTGLSARDFIAPTSFDFRNSKFFKMGATYGAVSFLQILAPELSDKMLADFLDMDNTIIVNLHAGHGGSLQLHFRAGRAGSEAYRNGA